ncbi:MAG: tetratricopeptide repeat protein, partial [Gammaproteobacteria bacterium]|nr:tetratricopeptide repeat protein [Gammaproteobacteria bacterium]
TGQDPRHAGAHSNLGLVLEELGESEQAIQAYEQAVACDPEFYPAYQNLLGVLVGLGHVDRAYPLACALLERPRPETVLPVAIDVLGQACDFARRARAWSLFDERWRAGHIAPATLAKALFSGNYESELSEAQLFEYHRAWGEWIESRAPVTEAMGARSRPPGEKVRIAYLSPDFRQHPVGYFIQHVLAAHDRARFEVICYSNSRKHDSLTDFIRAHADRFTTVAGLSDVALAGTIRDDGVDILVDLAGHTSGNRLPVLALRPAPLQMTWIGYLNTTGLRAVDYRVSDPYADPEQGILGTERLLRLSECFLSFGDFPTGAVDPQPACLRHGHVTFASFNNLMKLTAPTVRLWAEILKRVEGSRLVVMAVGAGSQTVRAHLRAEFAGHGVDPERLVLKESLSREAYFDFHNAIDVMLDSFPYNGGTVTCGALCMGVPVVTRVGPAHRQRVSYSLLKNVGLDETIAWDDRQYVEAAVRLAGDPTALARLRRELPGRLRASVLGDTARFTRQLEAAYLRAWGECPVSGGRESPPAN